MPMLRRFFSNDVTRGDSTETVVLITPHIVSETGSTIDAQKVETVRQAEQLLDDEAEASETQLEEVTPHWPPPP